MSYRDARRGAAITGTVLFGLPVVEVLHGLGTPGPTHFVVALFGLALVALSIRLR
jgi:hypothetical protein